MQDLIGFGLLLLGAGVIVWGKVRQNVQARMLGSAMVIGGFGLIIL